MAERNSAEDNRAFTYHGGALDVAHRLAPRAPEPWIDLSTGVNPYPYPLPKLEREVWSQLPTAEALLELEAAAAFRYGVTIETVVAGPGSQALIQALSRMTPYGAVGVLGPTYGGHAEAFAAAGACVREAKGLEAMGDFDVAVVVNPNNPDGRVTTRADLLKLHGRLARRGKGLIVDEAFADFDAAGESLAPVLPASGAVVLRSFGKSFGLPGLRLGFAIASGDVVKTLRAVLGPWPVSGPAIAIGTKALADLDWVEGMRVRLGEEAARLDALLKGNGWRILGGTRLFRLGAREDAGKAFRRLLAVGILARPFAGAPDRLRFGIPCKEADWRRLASALSG